MGKTWVLDTETKGTGAHVVPLEQVLRKRAREPELNLVELGLPAQPEPERQDAPSCARPRRFKVIDVRTRQTLAEHTSTSATLDALSRVRSIVDVHIYAWSSTRRRWRLLGLDEQRALWRFRSSATPDAGAPARSPAPQNAGAHAEQ